MTLHYHLDTPVRFRHRVGERVRFSGWCFGRRENKVSTMTLVFGGQRLPVSYGLSRPDVADYFDETTAGASGFVAVVQPEFPGEYKTALEVVSISGETIRLDLPPHIVVRASVVKKAMQGAERFKTLLRKIRDWWRFHRRLPGRGEFRMLVSKSILILKGGRKEGVGLPNGFVIPEPEDRYQAWVSLNQPSSRYISNLAKRVSRLRTTPRFSIAMPVYNADIEFLKAAVESARAQTYENWELCIADDASNDSSLIAYLRSLESDDRIHVAYRERNGNISAATNTVLEMATGDFVLFLDQDDELEPHCLGEIACYINAHPDTDVLYTDDDKIDAAGNRFAPQFKPDWSPELLLSYMYFSHAFVVRRELIEQVGGLRSDFDGSQDYDLALRVTEHTRHVGHVPMVLYHWRVLPGSTADSGIAKPASIQAGRAAVQDWFNRNGIRAKVEQAKWAQHCGAGVFRHRFDDSGMPSVTVIIPTRNNRAVLERCISSILKHTRYPDYQILVVDNESDDAQTLDFLKQLELDNRQIRVVRIANPGGRFNFAAINNRAVELVETDLVLFLNDDTEVISSDWLVQMVGYWQLPGVGAVGAKLVYPDGRIQHAGILHGLYDGFAGPAFKLQDKHGLGYLSYVGVSRNYAAVTAACMLTSRKLFQRFEGFDEDAFGVAYNDVDFCYRLVQAGLRIVYCPDAELVHHEGVSRGFRDHPAELRAFREKYADFQDAYYNPNLSLEHERFDIDVRCTLPSGRGAKRIRALMCSFNLNLEGAPFSQFEMTCELRDQGVLEPVVYSPADGPLRIRYEEAGIPVWIMDHPLLHCHTRKEYRKRISAFARSVRDWDPEIVYGNTLQTFYAIDAARELGIPSIWNPRESESWRTYFDYLGPEIAAEALRCFRYPYRIVYVAHATRERFRELDSRHNAMVIHNGLNMQRLRSESAGFNRERERLAMGVNRDEVAVLLLGTVCERKGQLELLQAVEQMAPDVLRRARFFVVGDRKGDYSQMIHRFLGSLDKRAAERIHILPEQRQVFRFYQAADVFVCTSRLESYPRVILEAMAFGLPIVTTPVAGIVEQVKEDVNASFYPAGSPEILAQKLTGLIQSDQRRSEMGLASKILLNTLTDFDEMCRHYACVFREAYVSHNGGQDA